MVKLCHEGVSGDLGPSQGQKFGEGGADTKVKTLIFLWEMMHFPQRISQVASSGRDRLISHCAKD
jgi:hypothetical protein